MQKSLFNRSIYRMWLRRYWVGGALLALFFVVAAILYGSNLPKILRWSPEPPTYGRASLFISDAQFSSVFVVLVGAASVVASVVCLHYMQNPRSASMVHSLPPRRNTILSSVSLAAFTLLTAPILLSGFLFGVIQAAYGVLEAGPIFVYLLLLISVALFWFGVSTFVGMLTGHSVAQGALTLIFVNLPLMLESVFVMYGARYWFGFSTQKLVTQRINPFFIVSEYLTNVDNAYRFGQAQSFLTPCVLIVIGAFFLWLSAVLYRRRKTEAAGEIIAIKALRPVFKYSMAILGAIIFSYTLGTVIFIYSSARIPQPGMTNVLECFFSLLGAAIGFFAAEMLLRRTVRVFKHFKEFLVFAGVYTAVLLVFLLDLTGYGSRGLNAGNVEYIAVGDVSLRVEAAMSGGPVYPDMILADLELRDSNGYLERMAGGDRSPLPSAIAEQILQNDASVYSSGDEMADAILLQNMLADKAGELHQTRNAYTLGDAEFFSVTVLARQKNGSTFRRVYQFFLAPGEQPELRAQLQKVYYNNEVAYATNVMRMARHARLVAISPSFYTSGSTVQETRTLGTGEWGGLLEAYVEDVSDQEADRQDDFTDMPLFVIFVEMEIGRFQTVTVSLRHTRTLQWLLDQGYLSPQELEEHEAFARENYTSDNYSFSLYIR